MTGAPHLGVRRITRPAPPSTRGANHSARLVVEPDAYERQSPFLMLAEDWFAPPAGFPTHPHRGMETVTFVLDGELEHRDHTGAHGRLGKGDVQFMTAGSGVLHSEMPGAGGVHSLQLWLNLPAERKFAAPGYRDVTLRDAALIKQESAEIALYTGATCGAARPFASTWPMALMDSTVAPGGTATLDIAARSRAFAYILEGEMTAPACAHPASQGQVVWFETSGAEGGILSLKAGNDGCRALIYAAEPINEPAVFGGPFVMNSRQQIEQAFEDFREGRLIATAKS